MLEIKYMKDSLGGCSYMGYKNGRQYTEGYTFLSSLREDYPEYTHISAMPSMDKLKKIFTNVRDINCGRTLHFTGKHKGKEYEIITSEIVQIEFVGQCAVDGLTIEVETRNTIYRMQGLERDTYFYLLDKSEGKIIQPLYKAV